MIWLFGRELTCHETPCCATTDHDKIVGGDSCGGVAPTMEGGCIVDGGEVGNNGDEGEGNVTKGRRKWLVFRIL